MQKAHVSKQSLYKDYLYRETLYLTVHTRFSPAIQNALFAGGLNLGRLATHYVSGWYEKGGHQPYVNRGIGTTSFPIRLGARPEISVFELSRT